MEALDQNVFKISIKLADRLNEKTDRIIEKITQDHITLMKLRSKHENCCAYFSDTPIIIIMHMYILTRI